MALRGARAGSEPGRATPDEEASTQGANCSTIRALPRRYEERAMASSGRHTRTMGEDAYQCWPARRRPGLKLVRRSMATIARKRIGEANWIQGQMILGARQNRRQRYLCTARSGQSRPRFSRHRSHHRRDRKARSGRVLPQCYRKWRSAKRRIRRKKRRVKGIELLQ